MSINPRRKTQNAKRPGHFETFPQGYARTFPLIHQQEVGVDRLCQCNRRPLTIVQQRGFRIGQDRRGRNRQPDRLGQSPLSKRRRRRKTAKKKISIRKPSS